MCMIQCISMYYTSLYLYVLACIACNGLYVYILICIGIYVKMVCIVCMDRNLSVLICINVYWHILWIYMYCM